MTEEQAKTKWCPMMRYTMDSDGNFLATRALTNTGFEVCIASDCMSTNWGGICVQYLLQELRAN